MSGQQQKRQHRKVRIQSKVLKMSWGGAATSVVLHRVLLGSC